jgi:hydrogenase nickel incorporation protein HypA/HybF
MHELGIANSVFEAVKQELNRHAGGRASKVGLRIGEWAGVDPDALRFCFESIVKETPFEPLVLEIETCPRQQICLGCGQSFRVQDYDTTCPHCRSSETECTSGTELELSFVELEEA